MLLTINEIAAVELTRVEANIKQADFFKIMAQNMNLLTSLSQRTDNRF